MASRKRIYLFGSILVLLLAVAAFVEWGLNPYFSPKFRRLLQEVVVKGSDSLYRLDIGGCTVHVLEGSVTLTGCHLSIDSNQYARKKQEGTLPSLTATLQLTQVKVSGFNAWKWFMAKRVDCSSLTLVGATMTFNRHPGFAKPAAGAPSKELYPLIESSVRSIRIGEILLGDLRVSYDNGVPEKPFRWGFERCEARLGGILVDSSTVSDSTRIAYASSLTIGIKQASFLTGKGLYRLTLGELDYDFKDRAAVLRALSLQPVLNAVAFYKAVGFQQDRYTFNVPKINLIGVNISELLQDDLFHIDSAYLEHPKILITNDRRMQPSGRSKMGKYPNQLLLNAPVDIVIRRVKVERGSLAHGETDAKTGKEGLLTFGDVYGQLTHVTNVDASIKENPFWKADLHATFLDKSPLHALFTFDLRSPTGRFSVQATLQDLEAAQLNPVTTALAGASIHSFHLDQLDCSIQGDERGATGNLHMRYRGLKLELLKKSNDTANAYSKPLLSFLVNKLAIRSDNPDGNKPEEFAEGIVQQRDPYKSFFNLIWKTMLEGIRSIAMKGLLKPKHK